MGLFEKAGRRFEKFKKAAENAAEEEAEYGCTACETVLYTDHDQCPECGADAVVSLDADGSGSDGDDGGASEDPGSAPDQAGDEGTGSADDDREE